MACMEKINVDRNPNLLFECSKAFREKARSIHDMYEKYGNIQIYMDSLQKITISIQRLHSMFYLFPCMCIAVEEVKKLRLRNDELEQMNHTLQDRIEKLRVRNDRLEKINDTFRARDDDTLRQHLVDSNLSDLLTRLSREH